MRLWTIPETPADQMGDRGDGQCLRGHLLSASRRIKIDVPHGEQLDRRPDARRMSTCPLVLAGLRQPDHVQTAGRSASPPRAFKTASSTRSRGSTKSLGHTVAPRFAFARQP